MKFDHRRKISEHLSKMFEEDPRLFERGRFISELHRRTGISRVSLHSPYYEKLLTELEKSLTGQSNSRSQQLTELRRRNEDLRQRINQLEKETAGLRYNFIKIYGWIYSTSFDIKGLLTELQIGNAAEPQCPLCLSQRHDHE